MWRRMSGPDRRHAVAVARRVDDRLRGANRPVLAAALLHDVGKVDSGLGTPVRVVATLAGVVGGDRVFVVETVDKKTVGCARVVTGDRASVVASHLVQYG